MNTRQNFLQCSPAVNILFAHPSQNQENQKQPKAKDEVTGIMIFFRLKK